MVLVADVLVTVEIVAVSVFNIMQFYCCTIRCCIVLMLYCFNFGLAFAAYFNAALCPCVTI